MKHTLKTFSLLMGIILIDAKTPTLSAQCSPDQDKQYKGMLADCSKTKSNTASCQMGAILYGWFHECVSKEDEELVFGNNERAEKFKEYLGSQLSKMQPESGSPKEVANNLYEAYKKFKTSKKS